MNFDYNDFSQCDKLIWSIANKEYFKYKNRVSFVKLDLEDFYQNGWLALQDCKNKKISELNYICVAIRNSMYRGVEKSSIIQTSNKKVLWYYISGKECRMEDVVTEDGSIFMEFLPSNQRSFEDDVVNKVTVDYLLSKASDDDRIELKLLMSGEKPKRRRVRELSKKRAFEILIGKNPYKKSVADKHSSIKGVTYDKSQDRWVYRKNNKSLFRSKSQIEVEQYAMNY